jgi:hypothetical protein
MDDSKTFRFPEIVGIAPTPESVKACAEAIRQLGVSMEEAAARFSRLDWSSLSPFRDLPLSPPHQPEDQDREEREE